MSELENILEDPKVSYNTIDDRDILSLINAVRRGIAFSIFDSFLNKSPFTIQEWSNFLHISDRTMQRYKKEKRKFDPLQSEKILQISLLYRTGTEIFGSNEKFDTWLETTNVALGKVKPKELLDNTFGISLLHDELLRIEHGILA